MKCPYVTNVVTNVKQHKLNIEEYHSEDANIEPRVFVGNDETRSTFEFMTHCIESDCAAWQGGHCVRTA